ncbi:hypothetical protein BJV78DRAFT_1159338, partial [Lactifluus subvellereus]
MMRQHGGALLTVPLVGVTCQRAGALLAVPLVGVMCWRAEALLAAHARRGDVSAAEELLAAPLVGMTCRHTEALLPCLLVGVMRQHTGALLAARSGDTSAHGGHCSLLLLVRVTRWRVDGRVLKDGWYRHGSNASGAGTGSDGSKTMVAVNVRREFNNYTARKRLVGEGQKSGSDYLPGRVRRFLGVIIYYKTRYESDWAVREEACTNFDISSLACFFALSVIPSSLSRAPGE